MDEPRDNSVEVASGALGLATYSDCRKYRYTLRRSLSRADGHVVWILLNPSTATEEVNDPTVAKCCGYTQRAGYGMAIVVNLFALRSTDPKALKTSFAQGISPIGHENDRTIVEAAISASMVICGWGRYGDLWNRGRYVTNLLLHNGLTDKLHYLKLLGDNTPGHPLYIKNSLIPQPWATAQEYANEIVDRT